MEALSNPWSGDTTCQRIRPDELGVRVVRLDRPDVVQKTNQERI